MADTHVTHDTTLDLHVAVQTIATADELWRAWQHMRTVVETAGERMTSVGNRWKRTVDRDPVAAAHLWTEYETAAQQYRLHAAWKDVFYAAYIFATDGADCPVLIDSSPAS